LTIDWIHFTPWTSLAGGVLLGLASALFILLNGRVLGISGILGGLLRPQRGDTAWRVFFIAGLLVGWGTSYGSGCTSGHGVCGLSRLSPRSLIATLAFMGAGFATVWLARHLLA
jgi:uncharacterized membrane protein YedE/YeeE